MIHLLGLTNNKIAFLEMIKISEIGYELLKLSDDGYNVCVGSTVVKPILFYNYDDHPRILNKRFNSTASGAYQILERYFDAYKKILNLPDFSPASQDAIALQQIKERRALDDIDAGRISEAILKCHNIWASFTGAGYGQHEHDLDYLQQAYVDSGGIIA